MFVENKELDGQKWKIGWNDFCRKLRNLVERVLQKYDYLLYLQKVEDVYKY